MKSVLEIYEQINARAGHALGRIPWEMYEAAEREHRLLYELEKTKLEIELAKLKAQQPKPEEK